MTVETAWFEENIVKRALANDEKEQLQGAFESISVGKGETIVSEGSSGDKLFLVRSGYVGVFQEINGQQSRLTGLGEAAIIGEVSFLSGSNTTASVIASEESVVYTINRSVFAELMKTAPELVFSLFTYILLYQSSVLRKLKEDQMKILDFMSSAHK